MKKQILLTVGLVLTLNGLFFLWYILFSNNFVIVDNSASSITWSIILKRNEKVIEQNIVKKYDITNIQSQVISTIKQVGDSVVSIVISKDLNVYYYSDPFSLRPYVEKKKEKVWGGSGIIVSKAWYILTNKHVVSDLDASYSVVTKEGDVYKVDKIWTDPILDIAILHIVDKNNLSVHNLKPAKIIDFKANIDIGQFVIAIGNALAEYSDTVTFGILSAKWRQLEEDNGSLYIGLYQTDAAINPGNSGWPLINIAWEVIWVNTAISAIGQWIGFSIPINRQFVQATLESIKKYWKIKRPLLGVKIILLNKTIAKTFKLPNYEGVLVQDVIPWSPAYKAWIKKWDIILKVDDVTINKDRPIIYSLFTHNIWDKVKLLINRNWKYITKEIKLTEF